MQVSTDVVFDGEKGEPYTEEDEPAPLTDYGRAKADAERGVLEAHPGALVVRTSLIYGGERAGAAGAAGAPTRAPRSSPTRCAARSRSATSPTR